MEQTKIKLRNMKYDIAAKSKGTTILDHDLYHSQHIHESWLHIFMLIFYFVLGWIAMWVMVV